MRSYVIDFFDPEARDFIDKMAYVYGKLENNKMFYNTLSRSQKFLSLILMTHLIFETSETIALEKDGYSLGYFADFFNLDISELRKYKDTYSEEYNSYMSLDIVGKDMIFNRYLIQSLNELKNYRNVYDEKGVSIKEMFLGFQDSHCLEYGSLNNMIRKSYKPNSERIYFNESNLCDYYDVEFNELVGLFVPKGKVKVKSKEQK